MLAFPLLFLEIYLIFSVLMALVSGWRLSGLMLARVFIFTLVPIAIAYHIAHYLSFLLVQGQRLLPLASDPFGFGWNLLGTAEYGINIGIVGAQFGWYTMVLAIVAGHIIAVYLAHLVALRTLRQRTIALRSQYPMLVLMVGYTMLSLWILAQPIVESDEAEEAPSTAQSRGICQGFAVLPNGSAVLSGVSAAVHRRPRPRPRRPVSAVQTVCRLSAWAGHLSQAGHVLRAHPHQPDHRLVCRQPGHRAQRHYQFTERAPQQSSR